MSLTQSTLVKVHVSFGASVVAWLPSLDYSFRIVASTIAIIAGLPVAIRVIKDFWKWTKK